MYASRSQLITARSVGRNSSKSRGGTIEECCLLAYFPWLPIFPITVNMSAGLAELVQVSYSNQTLIVGITGMEMVYLLKHITFLVIDKFSMTVRDILLQEQATPILS